MNFFRVLALALAYLGYSADVQSVTHALEARYQHARTLKAIFLETYSDGSGGMIAESGTVYFSKPGRMRWEYESPEDKLFLVDGTNVWFYVPADHTASRAKLKQSSDWRTPLALLAGDANFLKLCQSVQIVSASGDAPATDANRLPPGDTLLKCTPRGTKDHGTKDQGTEEDDQSVLLEVDAEGRLVKVAIHQSGNSETEFRFGNWEENIPIPETKFHFQPPPGVAIVDQESLGTGIR